LEAPEPSFSSSQRFGEIEMEKAQEAEIESMIQDQVRRQELVSPPSTNATSTWMLLGPEVGSIALSKADVLFWGFVSSVLMIGALILMIFAFTAQLQVEAEPESIDECDGATASFFKLSCQIFMIACVSFVGGMGLSAVPPPQMSGLLAL
jgi:hypothetical protein